MRYLVAYLESHLGDAPASRRSHPLVLLLALSLLSRIRLITVRFNDHRRKDAKP